MTRRPASGSRKAPVIILLASSSKPTRNTWMKYRTMLTTIIGISPMLIKILRAYIITARRWLLCKKSGHPSAACFLGRIRIIIIRQVIKTPALIIRLEMIDIKVFSRHFYSSIIIPNLKLMKRRSQRCSWAGNSNSWICLISSRERWRLPLIMSRRHRAYMRQVTIIR